jgi:valyl-tRNA synthetase
MQIQKELCNSHVLHLWVVYRNGGKDRVEYFIERSKGNVIDPLEVMDSCTLDVLLQKLYESNLPESEIKKTVI